MSLSNNSVHFIYAYYYIILLERCLYVYVM